MENPTILCFDMASRGLIEAECDDVNEDNWSPVTNVNIEYFASVWNTITFSAVAIDDTVYVLTWRKGIYSIKPLSERPVWETHPISLYAHGPEPPVAVCDGQIYVCGGGWQEADWRQLPGGSQTQRLSRLCEVFDAEDENPQWQKIGKLLNMKRRNSIIEVAGKIYCIGGLGMIGTAAKVKVELGAMKPEPAEDRLNEPDEKFDYCDVEAVKSVEMYDPYTDIWVEKAHLRTARIAPGVAKYEDWIFALGGGLGESWQYLNSIECYNISTDVWQDMECNMARKRMMFIAYCNENEIIIVGGERYGCCSIEKIEVNRNADAIEAKEKSLTECFDDNDINRMATVFMSCPKVPHSMECDT